MFTPIRKTNLALSIVLALASSLFGQSGATDNAPLKGPPAGRGPMWDGPPPIGRLLDSLNLDAAQRQAIDASIKSIHEANKDKMPRPTEDQITQMQDLREQMHEAWQDQDETKVQDLKTQMDQITAPERQAHEQVKQQIHDAIKAQLRPDQVDAFETKWNATANAGPRGRRAMGGAMAVRAYHRAVMSLDLSADQKTQIEGFFQNFRNTVQNKSGQQQPTDHKAAFESLRTQVNSALTDAQKTQLQTRLQNMRGMHGRGQNGQNQPTPAPAPSAED